MDKSIFFYCVHSLVQSSVANTYTHYYAPSFERAEFCGGILLFLSSSVREFKGALFRSSHFELYNMHRIYFLCKCLGKTIEN